MQTLQQPLSDARPGEWWADMSEVFRLVPGGPARGLQSGA